MPTSPTRPVSPPDWPMPPTRQSVITTSWCLSHDQSVITTGRWLPHNQSVIAIGWCLPHDQSVIMTSWYLQHRPLFINTSHIGTNSIPDMNNLIQKWVTMRHASGTESNVLLWLITRKSFWETSRTRAKSCSGKEDCLAHEMTRVSDLMTWFL